MDKYAEILELFGIEVPVGYSAEEIEKAKSEVGGLPSELEQFYLNYGKSPELHGLQDELILPGQHKALLDKDYIIIFNENQGVCQAGIKKSDAALPDPPVYTSVDDGEWKLSCPRVSDFLIAMFGYQASICLEFSPEEFYFITQEEKEKIERLFKKCEQHFDNWLYDWNITLYGDNNNGRIALMDNGGDIQMNYAANTEEEFIRMQKLLDGIGEPI
ncbi:MAG: hypothetical protein J1F03_03170 [Oscillospiraceae bacterium]|nr:hypothetical protein [Oscillospiraceae bacterium]